MRENKIYKKEAINKMIDRAVEFCNEFAVKSFDDFEREYNFSKSDLRYERQSRKRDYCRGCRENFYNGNNNLGIGECWHLKSARVVRKKI